MSAISVRYDSHLSPIPPSYAHFNFPSHRLSLPFHIPLSRYTSVMPRYLFLTHPIAPAEFLCALLLWEIPCAICMLRFPFFLPAEFCICPCLRPSFSLFDLYISSLLMQCPPVRSSNCHLRFLHRTHLFSYIHTWAEESLSPPFFPTFLLYLRYGVLPNLFFYYS